VKAAISPTELQERKREAARAFLRCLLAGEAKPLVAQVILFGSAAWGEPSPESDVDVAVVGIRDLERLRRAVADAEQRAYEERGEGVEALVYPLERLRAPGSYFLYRVLQGGEAIYAMEERELRRREAENYLQLAEEYREGAEDALRTGRHRLAVDAAYNAAELCVKGLLLLQERVKDLPGSHGGLVGEFGKRYVQTGQVGRELGRQLYQDQALELRNRARYEFNAQIRRDDAQAVLRLAKELHTLLEGRLQRKRS